jgi:hypothetical protein
MVKSLQSKLRLTLIALLVAVSATTLLNLGHTKAVTYVEGTTPVYLTKPNDAGYGGTNLTMGDSVVSLNGILSIKVFYPTAAGVKDFGSLYSPYTTFNYGS